MPCYHQKQNHSIIKYDCPVTDIHWEAHRIPGSPAPDVPQFPDSCRNQKERKHTWDSPQKESFCFVFINSDQLFIHVFCRNDNGQIHKNKKEQMRQTIHKTWDHVLMIDDPGSQAENRENQKYSPLLCFLDGLSLCRTTHCHSNRNERECRSNQKHNDQPAYTWDNQIAGQKEYFHFYNQQHGSKRNIGNHHPNRKSSQYFGLEQLSQGQRRIKQCF